MELLQQLHGLPAIHPGSLSFLFVVLPLSLFVYYAAPQRLRPAVLLGVNVLLLLQAQPRSLILLLACLSMDYTALQCMRRWDAHERLRRACRNFSIAKTLVMLLWVGLTEPTGFVGAALGLSVYALSSTGCVLAAYRREIAYERNAVRFAACCCFFPAFYAGPLPDCATLAPQLKKPALGLCSLLTGWNNFIMGLFKYAVFGASLYGLFASVLHAPGEQQTVLSLWVLALAATLSLYYTLSGFSDMARGVGALFGLRLPQNYYYPCQSRSITDFFERFNSSVTAYLRKNLALPQTGGMPVQAACILFTASLYGLWFGLQTRFLLWGLLLGVLAVLERYALYRFQEHLPTLLCRAITFFCVVGSLCVLYAASPVHLLQLWQNMLGFGLLALYNDHILYTLSSHWLLLLSACFFATSGAGLVLLQLRKSAPAFAAALTAVVDVAVLVLLLALTVQ